MRDGLVGDSFSAPCRKRLVFRKLNLMDEARGTQRPSPASAPPLTFGVSTVDQKPDPQYDGLQAYAARAGLDIVQDYCDVAVSGGST
jgi:hypothetical protein